MIVDSYLILKENEVEELGRMLEATPASSHRNKVRLSLSDWGLETATDEQCFRVKFIICSRLKIRTDILNIMFSVYIESVAVYIVFIRMIISGVFFIAL